MNKETILQNSGYYKAVGFYGRVSFFIAWKREKTAMKDSAEGEIARPPGDYGLGFPE